MPSQLNWNISGDPGDDLPVLIADNPPGGTTLETRFEGVAGQPPNRFVAIVPAGITGGATLYYQHKAKSVRVIVPPGEGAWEAGAPPCLPPEVKPEDEALVYGPVSVPARPGVQRLVQCAWVDGGGPHYATTVSLLHALGTFQREGKGRIGQNLTWAKRFADGARIIYAVDWAERPCNGTVQLLDEFSDFAYRDCGMKLDVTVLGGGPYNRRQIAEEVLSVLVAHPERFLGSEAVNEHNATEDDAVLMAKILMQSGLPVCVGFGDAGPAKVADLTSRAGANVASLHLERTAPDDRQARQCWDFHEFRVAAKSGEPGGPGSSVASIENPFTWALMSVGAVICGAGLRCAHSGDGVYGYTYQGPTGPRYANLYDRPNAEAMYQAWRTATSMLYLGMENWGRYNTHLPTEVVGGTVDKQYGARSGRDFVHILTGTDPSSPLSFRDNEPVAWKKFYHPQTGQEVGPSGLDGYVMVGKLAA